MYNPLPLTAHLPTDRPILMSSPMVRATLARYKTMTRRVIKTQPVQESNGCWSWPQKPHYLMYFESLDVLLKRMANYAPRGRPGSRLWVKETYAVLEFTDNWEFGGKECEGIVELDDYKKRPNPAYFNTVYRADNNYEPTEGEHWKPSIFMPKWASRIHLAITHVRAERLHDIQAWEIVQEGVVHECTDCDALITRHRDNEGHYYTEGNDDVDPYHAFANLWDHLNPKYPYESNPFVWVYDFKLIKDKQ